MSPEAEARAVLARLSAEVAQDLASASARAKELRHLLSEEAAWTTGAPTLSVAALALHHLYTAIESSLQRILAVYDGVMPTAGDWHRELLRVACLDLAGIRSPILRAATARALATPLRFRHFLRHAYAVELDGEELRQVAERSLGAWTMAEEDLEGFLGRASGSLKPVD